MYLCMFALVVYFRALPSENVSPPRKFQIVSRLFDAYDFYKRVILCWSFRATFLSIKLKILSINSTMD